MNSFEELKKAITEIIDERIDKKLDEFSKELLGASSMNILAMSGLTASHGDCEKDNTMIKEIEKGSNSLAMSGLTAKDAMELMQNLLYIDGSHRTIHKPVKRMKKPNYADLYLKKVTQNDIK